MTTDDKLDQIIKTLERLEARQHEAIRLTLKGLTQIKEAAPPAVGSFASTSDETKN